MLIKAKQVKVNWTEEVIGSKKAPQTRIKKLICSLGFNFCEAVTVALVTGYSILTAGT